MGSQFYGRFTKLDPPIMFVAFEAAAVVQFNSQPFAPGGSSSVVGAVLSGVSGTTTKTLTFARAPQQFSFTDNLGDENDYEALMGGNVCQTGENERGYSHRNSRAFRGGDARDRCEPGDVLWHNGRGFLITSAIPFALAPSSVAWQGEDPVPTVWTWEANINNLVLPRPDYPGNPQAVNVWNDEDELFGGALLEIDNSGWEDVARFVFERPSDNTFDPFFYPADAQFSTSATEAEYWFDPVGERFRLASHNESRGNAYRASWWVTGLEASLATGTTEVWGVEDTSNAAGFDIGLVDPDSLLIAGARAGGDFDRTFRIYKVGASWPAHLYVAWRASGDTESPHFSVDFSGGGYTVSHFRHGNGTASWSSDTPHTFSGAFVDIRITKSGGTFNLYATNEGGSEQHLVPNRSLTDVVTNSTGWVGVGVSGNSGAHFSGFAANEDVHLVRVDADGRMGVRVSEYQGSGWTGVAYSDTRSQKTAEAIQSIRNETAGVNMTQSGTERRNTYDIVSGDIVIYSEASGDQVRITEEAPATAPGGTGRAPQVPNTVNFATPDSSDVNENRAHWSDQIQIHDPDDEFEGTAGQSVEIRRDAVFDSRNPPVLSWTFRDNASGDWTTMTSGTDYIGRWVAGLVFLSAAFMTARAGDSVDDKLCFRAEGVRIMHNGSQTARQFNDMTGAMDAFDELFVDATPNGIGSIRISGFTHFPPANPINEPHALVQPSAYTCVTASACWRPSAYSFGSSPAFVSTTPGDPDPSDFPYWHDGVKWFVTTAYDDNQAIEYCPDDPDTGTPIDPNEWVVPGLFSYEINPNANPPSTGKLNRWGSAFFNVGGPMYAWPEIVTGLPAGTVCVEAFARVRFAGLESSRTFHSVETRTIAGLEPVVVFENDPVSTPDLTVAAFVVRENSSQVTTLGGSPLTVKDYDFKSLGSGVPTAFATDQWKFVEVTALIQNLIDERDSKYTHWVLWPSITEIGQSADGLGGYLLSMLGTYSGEITGTDDCLWDVKTEAETFQNGADNFEIGSILARFRLPDGSLTPVLPIITPPFMEAP